jgi:hypothetical protein
MDGLNLWPLGASIGLAMNWALLRPVSSTCLHNCRKSKSSSSRRFISAVGNMNLAYCSREGTNWWTCPLVSQVFQPFVGGKWGTQFYYIIDPENKIFAWRGFPSPHHFWSIVDFSLLSLCISVTSRDQIFYLSLRRTLRSFLGVTTPCPSSP